MRPRAGGALAASAAALLAGALWWAAPAAAQVDSAAEDASRAAFQLRGALESLDEALSRDDQVSALTEVIVAYETGLAALRDGLRQAGLREQRIRARWEDRRAELAGIIGVMISMERSPETLMLLHPAGSAATARAGMILSSVAPGLQAEAEGLREDLDEIAALRRLQEGAAETLAGGLARVQEARRLLASAVTDRSTMPARFGEDPAELQALQQSARTLDEFATGLSRLESDVGPPLADFAGAQGSLRLPVSGKVLRGHDEPDAAGVARPGLVIATAPAALVTTPWPATIRHRGALLDYGNVMILEPAKGYLLVLAGLEQVFGEVGDVLELGEPVGLMGGTEPGGAEFGVEFVVNAATGQDADRTETLYMELRQGNETLDPAEWFVLDPIVAEQQGDASEEAQQQAETE